MSVETIALKCPNCGNSSNLAAKEMQLGYEFTCPFCSTTSVVAVNQQLYTPHTGELVCARCGRVAPSGSRFCQCGAALLRKCTNCQQEFPITHQICDNCGQPQRDAVSSGTSLKARLDQALQDLANSEARIRIDACDELRTIGPLAAPAIPQLLQLIEHDSQCRKAACQAIGAIGSAAKQAVPLLVKIVESDPWSLKAAATALGSIGDPAAIPALIETIKDDSIGFDGQTAVCQSLAAIGDEAIPALIQVITDVPTAREAACRALLWANRTAAQQLAPKLVDIFIQEPDSRELIGRSLVQIGLGTVDFKKAVDLLIVNDRDLELGELNEAAAKALSSAGDKAVSLLAEKLKQHQDDTGAVKALIATLGMVATPKAIDVLIEAFKTLDNDSMHDLAANALVRIGEPALPALRDLDGLFVLGELKREIHRVTQQIEYQMRKD